MQIIEFSQTEFTEYLSDESRMNGRAVSLSFPKDEEEVAEILKTMHSQGIPVTIQGARTGLSGGAVPNGGHILNLSHMNRMKSLRYSKEEDAFIICVQPGVVLADLKQALREKNIVIPNSSKSTKKALALLKKTRNYFLPPDPTETLASIGGLVSCNASGACSFAYGSIRPYIAGLCVVLADGGIHHFLRGEHTCKEYRCECLLNEERLSFDLPNQRVPDIKNSAGYYAERDMDLVDLFIGSEGTLGVICEIELKLVVEPSQIWACSGFFQKREDALNFAKLLKDTRSTYKNSKLAALEYIDTSALQLLQELRMELSDHERIPDIDPAATCVYFEFHGDDQSELRANMFHALGLLESCCGDAGKTLAATDARELKILKALRHAVPESANRWIQKKIQIYPDITTICIDMAVQDGQLHELILMYQGDLEKAGIRYAIYGHMGDNHIHCNILPGNPDEFEVGFKLYQKWAKVVALWGGTLSAEHGIGKQKSRMFRDFISMTDYQKMQRIKLLFDPDNMLNRDDIFS